MEVDNVLATDQDAVELRNTCDQVLAFRIYNQQYSQHEFVETEGFVEPHSAVRLDLRRNQLPEGIDVFEQQRMVCCPSRGGESVSDALLANATKLQEVIFEAQMQDQDPMQRSGADLILRNSNLVISGDSDRVEVRVSQESARRPYVRIMLVVFTVFAAVAAAVFALQ